jgi:hypothetical protein
LKRRENFNKKTKLAKRRDVLTSEGSMSLKQKKDAIILFSLLVIPVFLIAAFLKYFVSHDLIFLYIGMVALLLIIISVVVRLRNILNYIRAFFEKWK